MNVSFRHKQFGNLKINETTSFKKKNGPQTKKFQKQKPANKLPFVIHISTYCVDPILSVPAGLAL